MPTTHSKLFPLAHDHHFTMPFQPSKPCMLPGRMHLQNHDMCHLRQRLKQPWRSSMSITKEQLHLMCILLQWVCFFIFIFISSSLNAFSSRPSEEVCTLQEELEPHASRKSEGACQKEGMHWGLNQFTRFLPCEPFIECYEHLPKSNTTSRSQAKKRMTPTKKGHHHNIDDTASENSDAGGDVVDPIRPWFTEWNLYVTTNETIVKDMKIVQWWGVRNYVLSV